MEGNIYQAPEAEIVVSQTESKEFYVVAPSKFLLLFILTVGFYGLYWFYKNFDQYRKFNNESLWPIPRALFSIFFAHSLTNKINDRLEQQKSNLFWSPGLYATLYVVFLIVDRVSARMAMRGVGEPWSDIVSLMTIFVIAAVLLPVQKAANEACGDPKGESNKSLTPANYAWLIVGSIYWLFIAFGTYVYYINPDF